MNIEHLKYVLEVDRAGSISQAAENLYMGQPNLSKAIKELESTLNITIFKRTPRGAEITANGREFLRYARSILRQYEEMEALGKEDRKETQNFRVSVPRASYIVEAFTSFLLNLDGDKPIQVDFWETNALRAIQHVADGVAPMGIIRCKAEYQNYFTSLLQENGLVWRPLLEFEYLLLLSNEHPLAEKDIIDEEELLPYTEIIHGDTSFPRMAETITETERGYTPGDKKVTVYERGSQFDILTRVPTTYMWVSPMPQDLLTRNQLVQKRPRQGPRFNDILIHLAGRDFTPLEKMFLSQLEESVDSILSQKDI